MFDFYGMGYGNEYNTYEPMANNGIMGVYTQNTQISINLDQLLSLGFTLEEINTLNYIIMCNGKVTQSALVSYGLPYETAQKIKYMYDIATGKISINSTDDLVKHLRKTFGAHRRIGINDLALSKIQKVPRKAVVAGIGDTTFCIYNSMKHPANERMYDVVDVTGSRIFIETSIKPVLKYKQPKKIDGVIEIINLKDNGNVVVAINKEYARLCNRYIIVGSLRRPEFHHGMVEIICIEGTRVYIYAQTMNSNETVKYNGGTQRVYDYGFYTKDITSKLVAVASEIYNIVNGVYAADIPSNSDFHVLSLEQKEPSIEDSIEE